MAPNALFCCPGHSGNGKRRFVPKPNRLKLDRESQALTEKISAKEAELKALGRPNNDSSPAETAEREVLIKEQKSTRELKESTITKRKEFDDNIHKLSDDISKKSDVLSKIKANLPHKTEKAIDDNIRKLEYQLQTQHFKLRDEKRIVNEITKLRRSKKEVHEYLAKRTEIESYIRKKEEMKKQRNFYFKKVTELKSKEDEIRQKLFRMKSKTDEAWTRYREAGPQRDRIKKEIDSLYDMRRQLNADFQLQMRDYREFSELQRLENERQKEEEKKAQEANHKREWFEYETTREPFQEERAQIECLVTYLHRLLPKGEGQALSQGGSPLSGASPSSSVSSLGRSSSFKDEEGSYTILRKKGDEDDEVFEKAANLKKKKSKRKSWLSKPLRHSREIFNQFTSLGLSAPSTAMEIQDGLDRLLAKMQYYEDAAASVKMAHSAIPQDLSASSSFSSGVVTATDVEDTFDFPEDIPQDSVPGDGWLGAGVRDGEGDGGESAANMKGKKLGDDEDGVQEDGGESEEREDKCFQEDVPSIREPSGDEGGDVSVADLSLGSSKVVDDESGSVKLQVEGTVQSDESGSSGSDDSKEAGDVTDDSESTVVANEGEGGQSSPGDGSPATRGGQMVANMDAMATNIVVGDAERIAEGQTEPVSGESNVTMTIPDIGDDEVDKDREDSGMGDIQDGESKKGGIVERKNEKLKLIVTRKSEKDLETKADLLMSSQMEYSSDYASNSTGSAVSTPTDILLKREPLLDTSSLCRDTNEVEMSGFVLGSEEEGDCESILNANNNSSTLTSQHALQRPHLGSFGQEQIAGGEREKLDVFQSVDPPSFPVREEEL
ncbi:uncharacterized protein LOC586924 isoform X2 [Strongylocentrotus purpuratus]|uniref:Uncharacterized protein n=1 Tax=Strongylocentrotus purpuratus TaxID=7668 RepID=A0A7M7HJ05_STRPU|nr:uncharacterized protein LOC586924 isoform X2 [Strongylocentrotus purpuratus]